MWSLVKAVYNNTILTSNTEISAPVGFSYHCSENITFSNSSAAPVVEIARLQVYFIYTLNSCQTFFISCTNSTSSIIEVVAKSVWSVISDGVIVS